MAGVQVLDALSAQVGKGLEVTGGSAVTGASEGTSASGVEQDFAAYMRKIYSVTYESGKLNEEELFAGLIEQRLSEVNAEAATAYGAAKADLAVSMARPNGNVPWEVVAKAALKKIVADGKIEESAAEVVHAEAFRAAQLDEQLDAVYDGISGLNDPTAAVASMEDALLKARAVLDQLEKGELTVEPLSLDTPSNVWPLGSRVSGGAAETSSAKPATQGSVSVDGTGGFIWKPVSHADGKLGFFLPEKYAGRIAKVEIHSSLPPSDSTLLERPVWSSEKNGWPRYRFSKPGAEYPKNLYVVAFLKDGETQTWKIEDPSVRND